MTRLLVGLLSLFGCLTLSLQSAERAETSAAIQPVLDRFLSRPDEPLHQYRARRIIEGRNERFNKRGAIEAITELSASGKFSYTIVSATGSEYIREKVLEPLLETEAKVLASGNPSRSALTTDNYDIGGGELAGPGLVKLLVEPRRKEVSLIDGAVFITADDADLVRVEGRMAKNPSFWTTRVTIVRHYDRIAGVRVPVRLDSVAQIRFAGESTLSMRYDYEMINGTVLAR